MTMKVSIKDEYIDKFNTFIKSLPKDAVEVDNINDDYISLNDAKIRVSNAINRYENNTGTYINQDEYSKYKSSLISSLQQ